MVCTLEIEIGKPVGTSSYPVAVRATGGGEASGTLALDRAALEARRGELQNSVIASAVPSVRGVGSTAEIPVREVGTALFAALMTGHVYGQYSAARALASSRGEPLRIVLRLHPAELATLPWEMLFDDEHDAYLCKQEPLIRHVKFPAPAPPLVSGPLRVLGLVAAPTDLPRLDAVGEQQRLGAALAPLVGRVELRWAAGGSWDDLRQALTDGPWHVIHFIGHGDFDPRAQQGVLALEGADRRAHWVHADRIRDLISIQNPAPRLVVLNSCSSGRSSSEDVFSSTAATLVRGGCCAVVAMQYAITDAGAKAFAESLYQAIATNHSISDAVRIARIGIAGPDESLEWATPVLYLRGDEALDVPLFAVASPGGGSGPVPVQGAGPATPAQPWLGVPAPQTAEAALPPATPHVRARPGLPIAVGVGVVVLVAGAIVTTRLVTGTSTPGASPSAEVTLSASVSPSSAAPSVTAAASVPVVSSPAGNGGTGTGTGTDSGDHGGGATTPPPTPAAVPPPAVATVSIGGIGVDALTVSWTSVKGATGYHLAYRDDSAGADFRELTDARAGETSRRIDGLMGAHRHTVTVTPFNSAGPGPAKAATATTLEQRPTRLAAPSLWLKSAGLTSITVAWTGVDGAAGYRLDWVESPGGQIWNGKAPYYGADRREAELTGLKPGYRYAVTIRAFDADQNYGQETVVTFATLTG